MMTSRATQELSSPNSDIKSVCLQHPQPTTSVTVERPSSRSVNIFVNTSQICVEYILSSVRPSLGKCSCVWSVYSRTFMAPTIQKKICCHFVDGYKQLFAVSVSPSFGIDPK